MFATEGFGIDHLPYASFTAPGDSSPCLGTRIGEHVLALSTITGLAVNASAGLKLACDATNLDALLEAGRPVWEELRTLLQKTLADQSLAAQLRDSLHHVDDVRLHLPFTVGDYVDFYGNEFHASNVGRIFRPEQAPLTANWKHLPIGYHGRSGSIVPSETPVHRPKGMRPEPDGTPSFGPSNRLDIEAEVGFVLGGRANAGEVTLEQAENHIFGLTLTNDWSAWDIRPSEYVLPAQPGKSFATSIASRDPSRRPRRSADGAPPRDTPLAKYLDDTHTRPGI
jgi:fumarylacetoacetase